MVQCVKCVFVYNVLRKKSTIVRLVDGSSGKTPKNKNVYNDDNKNKSIQQRVYSNIMKS